MPRRDDVALRFTESLFRNRWLFIISVLVVSGVTFAGIRLRGNTWQADALTAIKARNVAAVVSDIPTSTYTYQSPAQQNVDQFTDMLKDNSPGGFLDVAIRNAHLKTPINVNPAAKDNRCSNLIKHISVTQQSNALFAISLTWNNASECERLVAAFQRQYIDQVEMDHSGQSAAGTKFLDGEIRDCQTRMRQAEQRLVDYKLQNPGQLSAQDSVRVAQVSDLEDKLAEARIVMQDATLKRAALQQRILTVSPYTTIGQNISENPMVSELLRVMAGRDILLAKYKPNHPAVLAANAQIANLERDIRLKFQGNTVEGPNDVVTQHLENPDFVAIKQQLVDATIAETTGRAQVDALTQQIAARRAAATKLPVQERELDDRTRDYSILKERYETLVKKREQVATEAALDKASDGSTLKPIGVIYAEPAITPRKILLFGVGSVVLGLVVGGMLLLISEWTDRSIRYATDAERLLGVPVLAVVPEAPDIRNPEGDRRGPGGAPNG